MARDISKELNDIIELVMFNEDLLFDRKPFTLEAKVFLLDEMQQMMDLIKSLNKKTDKISKERYLDIGYRLRLLIFQLSSSGTLYFEGELLNDKAKIFLINELKRLLEGKMTKDLLDITKGD